MGNWLCRRVLMAMFVVGGGIEGMSVVNVESEVADTPLGFLPLD